MIQIPQATVVAALLAALAALGVEANALRLGRTAPPLARRLTVVAAALTVGAFLFLLGRFLAADISYQAVFLYAKTDLPLRWRLAAAWTGREGSLLLWTAALAGVTALVARSHRRPAAEPEEERARGWTRLFLLAFLAAFLVAVA
ncbi:MAG TPA: c-type cytochrome biogenesis protein CcmF, partial [Candidatus Thermoplasmatota archaeon]|nr:c-type cytochrome biogenesis protein CcmF [Candidatus Thermoplasmatota archaeon]